EQDHAGGLEQVDVFGVEDLPERSSVAHLRDRRRGGLRGDLRCRHPGDEYEDELDEEHYADGGADRQKFEEARPEAGEADVEHHHHEQKQHHHRADIDDDQDHGEELGAKLDEQASGIEKSQDQKQHGMHRVLHGDHHEGRRHANPGEEIEEQRGEYHAAGSPLTDTVRR